MFQTCALARNTVPSIPGNSTVASTACSSSGAGHGDFIAQNANVASTESVSNPIQCMPRGNDSSAYGPPAIPQGQSYSGIEIHASGGNHQEVNGQYRQLPGNDGMQSGHQLSTDLSDQQHNDLGYGTFCERNVNGMMMPHLQVPQILAYDGAHGNQPGLEMPSIPLMVM